MNLLFGLKSFNPDRLLCLLIPNLSDQNFCGISHPANRNFYVLSARFEVAGILQELWHNSDRKISCLSLMTFSPIFLTALKTMPQELKDSNWLENGTLPVQMLGFVVFSFQVFFIEVQIF